MPLNLKVEFGGGLELLFSNQRTHTLSIPETIPIDSKTQSATETVQFEESEAASLIRRMASLPERSPANVTFLLHWLKDNLLKEREELFMEGDTVWAAWFRNSKLYIEGCSS